MIPEEAELSVTVTETVMKFLNICACTSALLHAESKYSWSYRKFKNLKSKV